MTRPHPSISVAVFYRDPRAAVDWLTKAFGFELDMMIEDETGALVHSQLRYGDGLVMVGSEWSENHQSPLSTGGRCTQTAHVQLTDGLDAHCEHARAAGAQIHAEPATQFYGDRTYRARDPEGHIWTFSQTVQTLSPAEWDRATGLKTWVKDSAREEPAE